MSTPPVSCALRRRHHLGKGRAICTVLWMVWGCFLPGCLGSESSIRSSHQEKDEIVPGDEKGHTPALTGSSGSCLEQVDIAGVMNGVNELALNAPSSGPERGGSKQRLSFDEREAIYQAELDPAAAVLTSSLPACRSVRDDPRMIRVRFAIQLEILSVDYTFSSASLFVDLGPGQPECEERVPIRDGGVHDALRRLTDGAQGMVNTCASLAMSDKGWGTDASLLTPMKEPVKGGAKSSN